MKIQEIIEKLQHVEHRHPGLEAEFSLQDLSADRTTVPVACTGISIAHRSEGRVCLFQLATDQVLRK